MLVHLIPEKANTMVYQLGVSWWTVFVDAREARAGAGQIPEGLVGVLGFELQLFEPGISRCIVIPVL